MGPCMQLYVYIQRFSQLASRIHREVSSIPTRSLAEVLLLVVRTSESAELQAAIHVLNFGLEIMKKLCDVHYAN